MAMNKSERAEMDALKKQLALSLAWRRTAAVVKDVMPPEELGSMSVGWVCYGADYDPKTDVACSGRVGHAVGRTDKTTTQGRIEMYSSKLLALMQARYQVEEYAAKKLAAIDAMIAAELEK